MVDLPVRLPEAIPHPRVSFLSIVPKACFHRLAAYARGFGPTRKVQAS